MSLAAPERSKLRAEGGTDMIKAEIDLMIAAPMAQNSCPRLRVDC